MHVFKMIDTLKVYCLINNSPKIPETLYPYLVSLGYRYDAAHMENPFVIHYFGKHLRPLNTTSSFEMLQGRNLSYECYLVSETSPTHWRRIHTVKWPISVYKCVNVYERISSSATLALIMIKETLKMKVL